MGKGFCVLFKKDCWIPASWKFFLMTFLLPILVAAALNFMGSIDLPSPGDLHFGMLENAPSPQTITWLERYGPVEKV